MPQRYQPSTPTKGIIMSNALFVSALTSSVSSLRVIVGHLNAKDLNELTIRIIATANQMTEQQYVMRDMESRIMELQLIATL